MKNSISKYGAYFQEGTHNAVVGNMKPVRTFPNQVNSYVSELFEIMNITQIWCILLGVKPA